MRTPWYADDLAAVGTAAGLLGAVVRVDRVAVAYDVAGRGEPLVLLPGQANNRHWWDPIRSDFTDDFTTIAIDTRGTGESSAPTAVEYSTRRFAEDVVAVFDALDITRAHIYGTSMSASARRGHRRASAEHDAWDASPRVDAPTMVIHGTDDQFW